MRLLDRVWAGTPRLVWGGEELVPDEVRARIGGAAEALRATTSVGDRIALFLPHGLAAPILLLACWEAGRVAVPIDTSLPEGRIRELLRRSGAQVLMVSGRRGEALGRRLGDVVVTVAVDPWPFAAAARRASDHDPEAPASIFWTSGSTGTPKGVTVPRRAIEAFVLSWVERLRLGAADRIAWTAALSFDLTLLDVAGGLAAGATVLPIPEGLLPFPDRVAEWLRSEAVTCWYAVPSLVGGAVEAGLLREGHSLRVLLYAGEAMPGRMAARIRAALPDDVVFANLFGPTETNVSCAYFVPPGWAGDRVPIGAPCSTIELSLLDEGGATVAEGAGATGEIGARGGTTMLGYWGEPERARWAEDREGAWLRTGDLARWRDDRALDFLGRVDRQTKIDGYRVEPDEIEGALGRCPGVREAAVVVRREPVATLVAVIVGHVDAAALDASLRSQLPPFAVPTVWEFREALPRTARGKVDRAALGER